MTTLQIGKKNKSWMNKHDWGFTLVELILVMALLAVILAIAAPTLSRFLGGRQIQEEARRILALTEYGRSQAISNAIPMELWMNVDTGEFGVTPVEGYGSVENLEVNWKLAQELQFEIEAEYLSESKAKIVFLPDGSIKEESIEHWVIRDKKSETVEIAKAEFGSNFVIQLDK